MEFEDVMLPHAQEQLMEITENSIQDWKTKLVEATNNSSGWDFQFVRVSFEDQQNLFFEIDCDVRIYFERQPPKGQWDYAGYADSYLTFSEIRIFYLESIYEYKGKTIMINGEEWEEAEITGFKNTLTYGLYDTIRHEIGHSLGLDHPKFESHHFVKESSSVLISPSIMIDLTEWNVTEDLRMEITDYDIRSVINMYGEDGINEINFIENLGIVIVAIFLIIIMIIINRKFRRKESEFAS